MSTEEALIGRDASCALRSHDPLLSSVHCRVFLEDERWILEDAGSANHTYVNGDAAPISRHVLRDRDVIRCGSLWIQFLCPGATEDAGGAAGRLHRAEGWQQALLKERDALRDERDDLQRELRQALEQLGAEREVGKALRLDLAGCQQELEAAHARLKALEADKIAAESELSMARADRKHLHEKAAAALRRQQELEDSCAKLFQEGRRLAEEKERWTEILDEKQRLIENLRGTPAELEARLRDLRDKAAAQAKELERARADRDVFKDNAQKGRLALEQAEGELRQHRTRAEQLERLLQSHKGDGAELARLTQANAALNDEVTQLRQRLARGQQDVTVLHEGVHAIVSEMSERTFALQKGFARVGHLAEDPRTVKQLGASLDQMVDLTQQAQGQLRSLRRLIEQG